MAVRLFCALANASRNTAFSFAHPERSKFLKIYGGQGRNRTADASLFRAALYRLSYLANTGGLHTCSFGGTGEDFVRTERV
jgi:hypothetical protein